MGLTLRGRFEGSPSYDMGAASFFRLRRDIAYTVSREYGEHYEQMPMACAGYRVDEYNQRTEELIRKYRCKERFLDFLYQSDIAGKLSPFKCKAVLDQLGEYDNNSLYGYAAWPEYCMTIKKFKELLRECFVRRKYLIWD